MAWVAIGTHLWQTTLVIALLLLLARALRNAPARFLLTLHWLALVKLFVPLAIFGGITRAVVDAAAFRWGAPATLEPGLSTIYLVLNPLAGATRGTARPMLDLGLAVLTLAWAAGASLLLLRTVRAALRAPDERLLGFADLDEASRAKVRLSRNGTPIPEDRLVFSDGRMTPGAFGLLRPRILLPLRVVADLDEEELRAVLLHEDAHRRRRDPLLAFARGLALSVYFFHPLVWMLVRRLDAATEIACDERAIRAGARPAAYVRAFSKTIDTELLPAPMSASLHSAGRSNLRQRVRRISEPWRYAPMRKHRIALGLAIAVVAVASLVPVGPIAGAPDLSSLSALEARDVPVTLRFEAIPLANILEALSRAAEFRLEVKDDLGIPATIEVTKTPLREVLGVLATKYGLRYEVPDAGTLVVRASTTKVAGGVTPPEVLSTVQPVYPDAARAAGREDKVFLTAIIGADGAVREVSVLKHAADPAFDESAMAAVRQWRYRPAMKDGTPVEVVFTVVINFHLGNSKADEKAVPI